MNKFLKVLGLFVVLFSGAAFAQEPAVNPVSQGFTIGDLEKLNKLDLTQIYIDQVSKLNMLIPYAPFNQKGEAVSLSSMGVPSTKEINTGVSKVEKAIADGNAAMKEQLATVIPYADKREIIDAILFVQSVIQKMEVGL